MRYMMYKVRYTANARLDLRRIYEYIAYNLMNRRAAANQTRRIIDAVKKLNYMPERHPLYDDEPWRSRGLRCFPVNNYVAFYLPKDTDVLIIRIVYGGRDLKRQLKDEVLP